jgi:predicted transposase/invertase (TIGR01784 family)
MLGLSELRQTRVYQEALEEGREEGQLEAKLKMVLRLLQRGFTVEEIAEITELDVETVMEKAQEQSETP